MKLTHEDLCEAWLETWRKYRGKKFSQANIWLSKQAKDTVNWLFKGNTLIDQCNVWLEEMSDSYGDSEEGGDG